MEPLILFALLPLGLFSFFSRKDLRGGTNMGILPLLTALLPVAAQGVMSLFNRNSQNSAAQQQARQQQRAELDQQKAQYYQQNYSPQAQANQALATLQLGRLAGAMGGINNVPPALRNLLQQRRTPQQSEYNLSSSQSNIPRQGGSFMNDLVQALPNFDVGALRSGQSQSLLPPR